MKHIQSLNEFFKIYEKSEVAFDNEKELKDILLQDEDFAKGDVHQALMNIGYNEWQKQPNWSYSDMLNYAEKYGDMVILSTLLGVYNYQVCNGGHLQYYDNGYASSNSSGVFGNYKDIAKHEDMVLLFSELGLKDKLKLGNEIYNIINQFDLELGDETESCEYCGGSGSEDCRECNGDGEIPCSSCQGDGENDEGEECEECGGSGSIPCEECGGSGSIPCENCDGSGEIVVEDVPMTGFWDILDDSWYKINEKALEEFNNYLKTLTINGEKISELIPVANSTKKYNL